MESRYVFKREPGAEKISDVELAKSRGGVKGKVNQKPAAEGLFGDGANQIDDSLFDRRSAVAARYPSNFSEI
jgi:hypothetical protein